VQDGGIVEYVQEDGRVEFVEEGGQVHGGGHVKYA
jgi:hypothetical protein